MLAALGWPLLPVSSLAVSPCIQLCDTLGWFMSQPMLRPGSLQPTSRPGIFPLSVTRTRDEGHECTGHVLVRWNPECRITEPL